MRSVISGRSRERSHSQEFPPRKELTGVTQVAIIFEGLGVVLEQNLIEIEPVDSLFGPTVVSLWGPIRPAIRE